MSIKHFAEKIKGLRGLSLPQLHTLPDDLFLGLIIILVAFGSFGLGRLSKIEGAKEPIRVENEPQTTPETFSQGTTAPTAVTAVTQTAAVLGATESTSETRFVGSKTGKKYHYPWCAGASRIAEANRVYFTSKADAEAQGYTPASNCKGL